MSAIIGQKFISKRNALQYLLSSLNAVISTNEHCNANFVSPQVNDLNVACHGNVELIFECEKPRYNGINQMGFNPKRRGLLGGVF